MTESFSVQEMRTHQSSLATVDQTTQQLAGTAHDTGIGDWKMYGVFASPIACSILAIGNAANTHAIDELASASAAVTEGFATTADLYEATEQSNVDLSRAISDQIDSMDRRSRR